MNAREILVVGALFIALGLGALLLAEAPRQPRTFDPTHATACRTLHAIAHTKRQRAEAMLACRHPNPDRWLGSLNLATAEAAR